ncbi:AAA family ATPase [bacterium]|nr:AAA family ATPase [bacterium]
MIKSISIENYRGFKKHHITFKELTLMVGKNNAGKSTLIEILRICSLVTKKYKNAMYKSLPQWVTETHTQESRFRIKGISPDIKKLIRQYHTIFYKYNEEQPYAKIEFENKTSIEIFYNREEQIFVILRDSEGKIIKDKNRAKIIEFPEIATLPQIGPLNIEENILQDETIKKGEMLSVTSQHFRNKLYNMTAEEFLEYKKLIEENWSELSISEVDNDSGVLTLLVREKDFNAEIGVMGHGLQMWMQILLFIYNSANASTLIIDEPDVYLHADLQKKLYKLLRKTKKQVIISTHSLIFIYNTDPKNILIIEKNKSKSKYASDNKTVQQIIDDIGYEANLELIKFANIGKCLYVEGLDKKILLCFAKTLGFEEFEEIPILDLGGKSQWKKILGASELTQRTAGNAITNFCIIDKDYHCEENNTQIKVTAETGGVRLFIWNSKEIENYLINPIVIARLINRLSKKIVTTPTKITQLIEYLLEEMKIELIDKYGNEILKISRGNDFSTIAEKSRQLVESKWGTLESKVSICSGKTLLKRIKGTIQEQYNVSFKDTTLANEFKREEIHSDICETIRQIMH